MSDDCIELLKNWTPEKMTFPAVMQQKWDGVPVRIRNIGGHHFAFSRQNENFTKSVPHIMAAAIPMLQVVGSSITMELIIPGYTFKKTSGIVRTLGGNPDCAKLIGKIFDVDLFNDPKSSYSRRLGSLMRVWNSEEQRVARICSGQYVTTAEEAESYYTRFMESNPDAEGVVVHSLTKPYQPGKRCWGTQRMKPRPTLDLRVHSFEEAVSKETGIGLGMVGTINVWYKHKKGKKQFLTAGVGPGKLTHEERKVLWNRWLSIPEEIRVFNNGGLPEELTGIAEIQYMLDDSYDALRQPTFQRWRPDKKVPDHE